MTATSRRAPFAMLPDSVLFDATMTSNAKVLYAALSRQSRSSFLASESLDDLGAALGLSKSTVRRAIRELLDQGDVASKRVGLGQPNEYELLADVLDTSVTGETTGVSTREHSGTSSECSPANTQSAHPRTLIPLHKETTTREEHSRDEVVSLFASFDDFWNAYPLKTGKPSARKAWERAVKRDDPAKIIEGAKRYAADPNRDARYTKHPGPWLNDDRWQDAPLPSSTRRPANDNASSDRARPTGRI